MHNLARTLSAQGNFRRAREMQEDVLTASRRVLDAEHPDILMAMHNLASTLSAQGDFQRARELEEDGLLPNGANRVRFEAFFLVNLDHDVQI